MSALETSPAPIKVISS